MAFFKLLAATVLIIGLTEAVPVPEPRRDFGPSDEALAQRSYNFDVQHQIVLKPSEYTSWHNETRQRRSTYRRNRPQIPARPKSSFSHYPNCTTDAFGLFNSSACPVGNARDRLNRIEAIKFQVLAARAAAARNKMPSGPNFMSNPMTPFSGESASAAAVISRMNAFSGKIQTYSAGCDLTSHTDNDDEIWTRPGVFHVFFNISSASSELTNETTVQDGAVTTSTTAATPIRRGRAQLPVAPSTTPEPTPAPAKTVLNIISAKLRLFKIGQDEVNKEMEASNATGRPGQTTQTGTSQIRRSVGVPSVQWNAVPLEKIFVRVFYYLPAAGRRHFRKKLLESKTLTVQESGWIDFDIQNAVKAWTLDENKNFGLEIEVENDDNELVDVHKYFSNLDCPVMTGNGSADATRTTTTTTEATPVKPTYPTPIIEVRSVSLPAAVDNNGVQSYTVPYPMSSFLRSSSRVHEKSEETPNEALLQIQHRRRHHHGENRRAARQSQHQPFDTLTSMQADSPAVEQTTKFTLAENHPLRVILGTASTGPFTNAGRGHRGYIRNHRKSLRKDLGLPETSDEDTDLTENLVLQSDSGIIS